MDQNIETPAEVQDTELKHFVITFDENGNPVRTEVDAEGNAKNVEETPAS